MKKHIAKIVFLLAGMSIGLLSGCSGDDYNEKILPTPYTDALRLEESFSGKTFTEPSDNQSAIGEVTLTSVTDGDTVNFVNGRVDAKTSSENSKALRFLGVNTPESTARIEPWGVKASKFTKSVLWDAKNNKQKVYSVVLQNDYSVWGVKEGNGRYLGFLWYKVNEDSPYRLLNLEIIEQCYSINELHEFSTFCPYLDSFEQAYIDARKSGLRVNGEKDPGYDYTNSIVDVSIRDIRENYENFGISESSGTAGSGIRLRVTAVIVMFTGDNIVVRDVVNPYPNGEYASIYVFSSITVKGIAAGHAVGEIITFVCRATTYNNNIQLTDVQNSNIKTNPDNYIVSELKPSTYGLDYPSDWVNKPDKVNELKAAASAKGWGYSLDAYDVVDSLGAITESTRENFEDYVGKFVTAKLTIREGDANDEAAKIGEVTTDYFRYSESYNSSTGKGVGSVTLFAKTLGGAKLNIRSLDYPGYYNHSDFINADSVSVGTTWYVIGTIAKYNDTYQLCIPNNITGRKNVGPAYHTDSDHSSDNRYNGFRWIAE